MLYVSNDAGSMPEEFSLKDIEVSVDSEEQNWLKRAHVEKCLGIEDIWASLNDLENCKMLTRQELIHTRHGTLGWSRPKDQQNKTDKFLLVSGVMYVIINSRNNKGKALKEHTMKDIVPRGLDARIKEIQEKHQQAITGRDNQIQVLEFRNEEHQQKILRLNEEIDDLMANRYVACRGCFGNVLCFIKKNSREVHTYYVIQCEYR